MDLGGGIRDASAPRLQEFLSLVPPPLASWPVCAFCRGRPRTYPVCHSSIAAACALDSRGSISFLGLGNRKRLQLFPYHPHLLAGLVEQAGVVDHIIGGFDFFCFGELRGHTALDFLAGEVER